MFVPFVLTLLAPRWLTGELFEIIKSNPLRLVKIYFKLQLLLFSDLQQYVFHLDPNDIQHLILKCCLDEINVLSPSPHYIKYFSRMKEIFRSVALLVPEGLRGYNGQKLILNLEPNTVRGRRRRRGGVMCKTYDEMIIKWAGRNSRQRRGSTRVSLVLSRVGPLGEFSHLSRHKHFSGLLHRCFLDL